MTEAPLRVAVVDDSTFVRRAIARMLEGDRRIEIVGLAASGEEFLANLELWRPEAVTLDLSMPGMGGLLTLDQLMANRPTPVIILSTHSAKDAPLTIEALHRGAIDFIDKQQYSLVDFQALRGAILEKLLSVRKASLPVQAVAAKTRRGAPTAKKRGVPTAKKAVTPEARRGRGKGGSAPAIASIPRREEPASPRLRSESRPSAEPRRFEVVALGASTGGPPTLQKILEQLGTAVPVPVVVVQHMPVGFTRAFADRLNSYLPLQVREAQHGEVLEPSTVYIAPAGQHLRIEPVGESLLARLSSQRDGHTHCPSVDVLFESLARGCGRRALVGLLTGMGTDGANGMKSVLSSSGYTLAQDEASCVVYGMPKAAMSMRVVSEEVRLEEFGSRLVELLNLRPGKSPSDRV